MALRFLEYKHDKNPEGGKIRPLWVDEGGVFYNTANHSYAGCCADDEVKVPDSVTQYANKAALQDRNKAIHAVTPFQKLTDPALNQLRRFIPTFGLLLSFVFDVFAFIGTISKHVFRLLKSSLK